MESRGSSMGLSRDIKLDLILYVDPVAYYSMPYNEKPSVARLIGNVNWSCREKEKHVLLMVPGRIGTSSPELGVPTSFSDISSFDAVCEIEETRAGYNPELSYGSHIFQDLVEAQIMYTALFHNEKTLRYAPEKLASCIDLAGEFEGGEKLSGIVGIYDVSRMDCRLRYDIREEHLLVTLKS